MKGAAVRVAMLATLGAGTIEAGPSATRHVTPTQRGGYVCTPNDRNLRCAYDHVVVTIRQFSGDRIARQLVEIAAAGKESEFLDCLDGLVAAQAVTVDLALDANGAVKSSVGKGRDKVLNACIADVIAAARFAKQRAPGAGSGWRHGKVTATLEVMFTSYYRGPVTQ
jgi:hypothetical protein